MRCLLYAATWVPGDGTYTRERYLYTVSMILDNPYSIQNPQLLSPARGDKPTFFKKIGKKLKNFLV